MINEDANKPMRYNHKTKRKLLFYLMMTSSRNANANPCNIILILFFLLIDKLVGWMDQMISRIEQLWEVIHSQYFRKTI